MLMVNTMKIGSFEIMHINAVVILVFCILYSPLEGLGAAVGGLILLYGLALIKNRKMPEEYIRNRWKFAILAGWSYAIWCLGLFTDNNTLLLGATVLIVFTSVFSIVYFKLVEPP